MLQPAPLLYGTGSFVQAQPWSLPTVRTLLLPVPLYDLNFAAGADAAALTAAGFTGGGGAPRITAGLGLLIEAGESVVATRAAGALDQGTVAIELTTAASLAANQMAYNLDDGTASNRLSVYRSASSTALAIFLGAGGVTQATMAGASGSAAHGATYRLAVRWATNYTTLALGGTLIGTDITCTVPAMTNERIGTRNSNAEPWNGYVRRIRRWSGVLDDAGLRSLSAWN